MKKIKFFAAALVLIAAIFLSSYRLDGNTGVYGIVIDMTSFTSDTVLYAWNGREFNAENAELIKVEIDYSALDSSDGTFSFGLSDFGDTYNSADATLFPFTMNYDSDTVTIPSVRTRDGVRASKMWSIKDIPSENFSIWLDRGSITSGYLKIRIKIYRD